MSYERSLPRRRIGEVQQCHHLRENKRRMEEEHGHNQSAKKSVASGLLSKLYVLTAQKQPPSTWKTYFRFSAQTRVAFLIFTKSFPCCFMYQIDQLYGAALAVVIITVLFGKQMEQSKHPAFFLHLLQLLKFDW